MDIEKSEAYQKLKLRQEEKRKSIKKGDNVFHLSYYDGLISEKDLIDFEKSLKLIDSQLSSYDKSGDFYALIDEFTLDTFLVLSQITIHSILLNSINSATWDTIKFVILSIWKKLRKKEITKITSKESKQKKITFGISTSLDDNTSFNFKLEGDISEETLLKSLDKTLSFLKKQKRNLSFKNTNFTVYDEKKEEWTILDLEKEVLKKIKKQKNKKN